MITHFPYGTDAYKSCGYERLPLDPMEGDIIKIRCISGSDEEIPILKLVVDDDYFMLTGILDKSISDNCYLFEIGPYKMGTEINYFFITEPEKEYKFEIRKKLTVVKCNTLYSQNNIISAHCLLNDGSLVVINLLNDKMGVTISASRDNIIGKSPKTSSNTEIIYMDNGHTLFVEKEPFGLKLVDSLSNELLIFNLDIDFFELYVDKNEKICTVVFSFQAAGKGIYGFGERFDRINQKGCKIKNITSDHFTRQEKYTYLPMPWMFSEKGWGIYMGTTCPMDIDIIPLKDDFSKIIVNAEVGYKEGLFPLNIILGKPDVLINTLHEITGKCKMPPKWVFGTWISANSWNTQKKVMQQLKKLRKYDIPATVLVLEAWSDEKTFYVFNGAKYCAKSGGEFTLDEFVFDKESPWPDLPMMVKEIAKMEMHLVLWQKPVINNSEGSECEQLIIDEKEAIENKYCIFNEDGTPYRIPDKWQAGCLMVDITSPEAVEWWLRKRKYLCDELNVDGFKTDGGEFIFDRALQFADGRSGTEMRNAYPAEYTQSYYDFVNNQGRKGILFSRAGCIGSQRRPLHWVGDQLSTFDEMKAQIRAMLSTGLSGIPFVGFDLAGFAGELPSTELYIRATEMAAFSTIMQFHSEPLSGQFGDDKRRSYINDRTPWNIADVNGDKNIISIFKRYAHLRLKLVDYIEAEAKNCAKTGRPLMCHLVYNNPEDENVINIDDEYMFGRSLLICPVTEEGARKRKIYLPVGTWYDFWTGEKYDGLKSIKYDCPLDIIPVFSLDEKLLE